MDIIKSEFLKSITNCTRNQFLNNFKYNEEDGKIILKNIYHCPGDFHLEEHCGKGDCKTCWEKAIENINFKGDDNMNKHEREYTFKEVMANIKEGEEYECQNSFYNIESIKYKNNGILFDTANTTNNFMVQHDAKFKLKRKESKVPFTDAIISFNNFGKTIAVDFIDTISGKKVRNEFKPIKSGGDWVIDNCNCKSLTPYKIVEGTWYILD